MTVGYKPMPADFRYRDVCLRGKPELPPRHPAMDTGHRAKIFAPFAALRGFDQAVLSKDVLYTDRIRLDEEELEHFTAALRCCPPSASHGLAAVSLKSGCA